MYAGTSSTLWRSSRALYTKWQVPKPLWCLIRNDPKLSLPVQTCPTGTSHWEKHNLSLGQIGQVVLVPVGQARCLYQTCPTGTGKGEKRPLLVPGTSHIPTLEAYPCSRNRLYTHDGACSRLGQVVQPLKWDYKAVHDSSEGHPGPENPRMGVKIQNSFVL